MHRFKAAALDSHALDAVHGGFKWEDFRRSENVIDMSGAPPLTGLPRGWERQMERDYNSYLDRGDFSKPYEPSTPALRDVQQRIDDHQQEYGRRPADLPDNNQEQNEPRPGSSSMGEQDRSQDFASNSPQGGANGGAGDQPYGGEQPAGDQPSGDDSLGMGAQQPEPDAGGNDYAGDPGGDAGGDALA